MPQQPRGREKNVTGQGKDIYKRGEGLNTGPVGKQDAYQAKNEQQNAPQGGGTRKSSSGGLLKLILIAALALGGGGAGLSGLLGGGNNASNTNTSHQNSYNQQSSYSQQTQSSQQSSSNPIGSLFDLSSIMGTVSSSTGSTGWIGKNNTGMLDTSVASGIRDRFTSIRGNGRDKITIMVYMCGTDLESRSGMATADLQEMCAADISDNINLIVYTGGCSKWNNDVISSKKNQIYQVVSGGLKCLEKDCGSAAMTKPGTLSGFIQYCKDNFKADRYELIFWDHGGGSLSGYGYDEKNQSSGSMGLSGIKTALKDGKVKFDFIGFDACLMATAENALMLSDFGDYLIASEETEPGIGWYYTNWLSKLSKNTSMDTIEIGKIIADDFVSVCGQKCRGQKATLSVVDLAEVAKTIPSELSAFASSTTDLIKSSDYKTVASARSSCREFSTSSIDQVDLVNLALNIGTDEAQDLADAVLGAVKYNKASSNMTNSYGLSIYFPYKATKAVSTAVNTYEAIGMDDDYASCIKSFASMTTAGSIPAAGSSSSLNLGSLLSGYASLAGGGSSYSSSGSSDMIVSLLSSMLKDRSTDRAYIDDSLDQEYMAEYISQNSFNYDNLVWTPGDEYYEIPLSQEQWELIRTVDVNVFYDDGEGYIDLGLDNIFTISDTGSLLGDYDGTWLAINDQPVAYYHIDTFDDGENYCITGRVPALLNGTRVDLLLVFDNEHPYGFIAGANTDYINGETETVAKNDLELENGDVIDFLCDYYTYDGEYMNSYKLGDQLTVDGELTISNVYINEEYANVSYCLQDIYCNEYWTPVLPE